MLAIEDQRPTAWEYGTTITGQAMCIVRKFPLDSDGLGLHAHLSWGDVKHHVRPSDWGVAKHFVDLEVILVCGKTMLSQWSRRDVSPWRIKWAFHVPIVAHIERGTRTAGQMLAMREWIKSCIDETGVEGLLALNARSKGAMA